jgi:hypothetical protein
MAKQTFEKFTTPRGSAIYPYLDKPDTKFSQDGYGEYKVELKCDLNDAATQAIITRIRKAHEAEVKRAAPEFKANPKNKGKTMKVNDIPVIIDEDAGTATFKFKQKAGGIAQATKKEWKAKVAKFDARGQELPDDTKIGGGSILKVSAEIYPYAAPIGTGVSLRIKACQVLTLREFGGGDAGSFGFAAEEGFDAKAGATENGFSDEEAAPADDSTGDDSSGSDF